MAGYTFGSNPPYELIEAATVRNLCGHQHADIVVLVQLGDLALELAGSFSSNDWISEAMRSDGKPSPHTPKN
jgi:hypothetical protein